jgi:hypothetical protein
MLMSVFARKENKLVSNKEEKPSALKGIANETIKKVNIERNPDLVLNTLNKKFKSPALVSALMGNIEHETGGSFDYAQKQYGGGPGRGLIQMEGGMLDAYGGYLNKTKSADSAESQSDFLYNIMNNDTYYDIGAGHRKKMQEAIASGDPIAITTEFVNRVERPGKPMIDRRIEATKKWFNKIGR